jgi:D-alanyl-D-alanine carboxypeptidase (penicillin-binding protein 5/6)
MENPLFKQIVSMKTATVATVDGKAYSVKNTNTLLGQYGINGVKTGYTEGAKEVLVTSATRNNHTFIIIVMKSNDRFADTRELLNSVVDKTTFLSIHL